MTYRLILGDAIASMRELPANSVQCCVTSPPYFSLRSYLPDDHPDKHLEIGTEQTPDEFVARLVEVFREVRRVLHPSGTCWIVIGDSYGGPKGNTAMTGGKSDPERGDRMYGDIGKKAYGVSKQLLMIPARVALALQADGWWLRSAITWCKGNPMPESVLDRPTSATEMVFMLAKSQTYFYDAEAIREEASAASIARISQPHFANQTGGPKDYRNGVNPSRSMRNTLENFAKNPGRNRRNWWVVNSEPYAGSHYATMPTKLVEPMVLAGSSSYGACSKCLAPWERVVERTNGKYSDQNDTSYAPPGQGPHSRQKINPDNRHEWGYYSQAQTTGWAATCTCGADVKPCVVLDPFFGSGTTAAVALKFGRDFIGIDLDARNLELARTRIEQSQPMLIGDNT